MVTTEAEKAKVIEAIQAGVTDYLCKPFESDELREEVGKIHFRLIDFLRPAVVSLFFYARTSPMILAYPVNLARLIVCGP